MNDKDNQIDSDKKDQANAPIDTATDVSHLYQPSKASFQEGALPEKKLKHLVLNFIWVYIGFLVLSLFVGVPAILIVAQLLELGSYIWNLAICLILAALILIPYIAYVICQRRIPKNNEYIQLRKQFIAVSVGLAILLPFVIPMIIYPLCAVFL